MDTGICIVYLQCLIHLGPFSGPFKAEISLNVRQIRMNRTIVK